MPPVNNGQTRVVTGIPQAHHHFEQYQPPQLSQPQQIRRPHPTAFQFDQPPDLGLMYNHSSGGQTLPALRPINKNPSGDVVAEMNKMYKRSPFMQRKKDVEQQLGTSPRRESKLSNFGKLGRIRLNHIFKAFILIIYLIREFFLKQSLVRFL